MVSPIQRLDVAAWGEAEAREILMRNLPAAAFGEPPGLSNPATGQVKPGVAQSSLASNALPLVEPPAFNLPAATPDVAPAAGTPVDLLYFLGVRVPGSKQFELCRDDETFPYQSVFRVLIRAITPCYATLMVEELDAEGRALRVTDHWPGGWSSEHGGMPPLVANTWQAIPGAHAVLTETQPQHVAAWRLCFVAMRLPQILSVVRRSVSTGAASGWPARHGNPLDTGEHRISLEICAANGLTPYARAAALIGDGEVWRCTSVSFQ